MIGHTKIGENTLQGYNDSEGGARYPVGWDDTLKERLLHTGGVFDDSGGGCRPWRKGCLPWRKDGTPEEGLETWGDSRGGWFVCLLVLRPADLFRLLPDFLN